MEHHRDLFQDVDCFKLFQKLFLALKYNLVIPSDQILEFVELTHRQIIFY